MSQLNLPPFFNIQKERASEREREKKDNAHIQIER
jgi:hypothetical protein